MEHQSLAPARLPLLGLAAALISLLVFGWLANEALRGQTAGFDASVRQSIHSLASPSLTRAMTTVTRLGSSRFLIPAGLLAICFLAIAGRRHAAVLLAVSALGGEALDQLLKLLFHRPRPVAFFGFPEPVTYSFPSGHALTACSFYLVLAAILSRRLSSRLAKVVLWVFGVMLAAAIGLSRVYLGVHYPSDVIAGYAAAVSWITALERSYAAWCRRAT